MGLLLAVLTARPSQAQNRARIAFNPTRVYTIENDRTGRIMEVGGGGNLYNNGQIDMWDYWGGSNQQWTFEAINNPNNGVYVIRNRDTKKVLTFNRYSNTDPSAGGSLSQEFITGSGPSAVQQWIVEAQGGLYPPAPGYTAIKCLIRLNASGNTSTGLEQTDYGQVQSKIPDATSNGYNLWGFRDISVNGSNDFTSSVFQIVNNNSNKALSMSPDGNSQSVGQMTAWQLSVEEWRIVPSTTTPDYYYIVNRQNSLVLEIGGNATSNGATLDVANNNQNAWQEWAFLDINDSHVLKPAEFTDGRVFKIYSRTAGKVVEIRDGSTNDGATAAVWNDYSLRWQQWRMQFSAYNRVSAPAAAAQQSAPVAPASPQVNLYPNPATDALSLIALGGVDLATSTVQVTDTRGSVVNAPYRNGKLDVSALVPGLYFVTIRDGEHTVRQKFTKQ